MKILTGLAIAQIVLVCLLIVRVIGLEARIEEVQAAPPAPARLTSNALMPRDRQPGAAYSLDEDTLRAIIREELDAARPAAETTETARAAAPTDPQQEIEYDNRLAAVRQSLDFYAQTGQISQTEMSRLQAQIARLRPADRENMFNRLVSEVNSGAIDGRL